MNNLHLAVLNGELNNVYKILYQNHNPKILNQYGETPSDGLLTLLKTVNFNHAEDCLNCLHCNLLYTYKYLLPLHKSGLEHSIRLNHFEDVRQLLDQWIWPGKSFFQHVKNDSGISKSIQNLVIQMRPKLEFIHIVRSEKLHKLKKWFHINKSEGDDNHKRGRFINAVNSFTGKTPLSISVMDNGNVEITKLLLKEGACPNIMLKSTSNDRKYPLVTGVLYNLGHCEEGDKSKHLKIFHLLLQHGVDLTMRSGLTDQHLTVGQYFALNHKESKGKISILQIICEHTNDLCLLDRDSEGKSFFKLLRNSSELLPTTNEWLLERMLATLACSSKRVSKKLPQDTQIRLKKERSKARQLLANIAISYLGKDFIDFISPEINKEKCSAFMDAYNQFKEHFSSVEDLGNDLFNAIDGHNISYLHSNPCLPFVNQSGENILHFAVRNCNLDLIELILAKRNVLLLKGDLYNRIPLHYAQRYQSHNAALISMLLKENMKAQLITQDVFGHYPNQMKSEN